MFQDLSYSSIIHDWIWRMGEMTASLSLPVLLSYAACILSEIQVSLIIVCLFFSRGQSGSCFFTPFHTAELENLWSGKQEIVRNIFGECFHC